MIYTVSIDGEKAGKVTVKVAVPPALKKLGVSTESVILAMAQNKTQSWYCGGEVTVRPTKVGFLVAVDGRREGLLQVEIDIPTTMRTRHNVTEAAVRAAISSGQAQQWYCMGDVRLEDVTHAVEAAPSM
jgi:hypothetical protein